MLDDMLRTSARPSPSAPASSSGGPGRVVAAAGRPHAPASSRREPAAGRPEGRAASRRPLEARASSAGARVERMLAVVGLVGLVGVLALLGAPAAQAHNTLRASDPADGAALATAPDRVTLTFDMPATALGTEVVVTAADGRVVSSGPAELVDATVAQPLAGELPAGGYTVQWRVTSADGHPIEGTYAFTAAAATLAGTGGAPLPAPEASPSDAASAEPTAGPTEPAATDDASAPSTSDDAGATADEGSVASDGAPVAGPLLVGVGGVLLVAGAVAAWYLLRRRPADATPATGGSGGTGGTGGARAAGTSGGDLAGPDA